MRNFLIGVAAFSIIVIGWAFGFLLFSGFVWLVCWAFDLVFSWKYAFGVWLVWIALSALFKTKVTVKNKSCDGDRRIYK